MSDFTANLIRTVNELQDRLNPLVSDNIAFDLPQIAVIGGQSSGKSSVLESFVGRDFLPRGNNIVTRRPLVLQLINVKNETNSYGKFLHIPGKAFYDFFQIRDEITAETDREVKNSYGISSKPINLKIYSPFVLDLTLVDLPGMTRIPVGNQPKDIESRIENMILEYIEKENCLILAVTPANQDLATSDALKLAKRVDQEGKRTIGVLTKLDLMDKGTDARDILLGKHLPLRMGYIGVINRSQEDIKGNKDMKTALEKEEMFFKEHPAYKDISKIGINYLQQFLHKKLSQHIFRLLPPLKQKFEKEVFDINIKLAKLVFPNQLVDKEIIISECHQLFCQHLRSTLLGEGQDIDLSKLSGGAKISYIMNKSFAKKISKMVYNEKQMRSDISKAIQNSFGIYLELFIPNTAFKAVVRNQIETFRDPSLNCIDSITHEIEGIVEESADRIERIPNLRELFTKLTLECLCKCKVRCIESVLTFIKAEKTYLNTIHEDLLKMNSIEKSKNISEDNRVDQKNPLLSTYCVIEHNSTYGWVKHKNIDFWFVLQNTTLSWFTDETMSEKKGSVDLKEAEFKYLPNKSRIVLILVQNDEMTLTFDSKDSIRKWKQWLERSGVKPFFTKTIVESNPTDSASNSSFYAELPNSKSPEVSSSDSSEEESEFPEYLKPQVKLMKTLVDSHYVIMKKKFKDQIPKICALELIDSIMRFVEIELVPLIRQTVPSVDDIIGEDPDKHIREELTDRRKHYSEAIEIIDKFSKQSQ